MNPLNNGSFPYLNRELSWLAFNGRVLDEALDARVPLLERLKFLAICSTNLDEFYMVRVAGLRRKVAAGAKQEAPEVLSPAEQMDAIRKRVAELLLRRNHALHEVLLPALAGEGVRLARMEDLSDEETARVSSYFESTVFPVLTPLAVDPGHPFPYISNLSLNLAIFVRNPESGLTRFARIKVPPILPRFVVLPDGERFVPLEQVIAAHLEMLFPGMEIVEHHTFRVTRNEDLEVEEDDAENLLQALEKELMRRRFGPAVRLEIAQGISPHVRELLVRELGVDEYEVYELPAPLDLTGLEVLHRLDRPELKYPKFVPVTAQPLAEVESAHPTDIFQAIRRQDVLLHHPYDSFSTSVQEFLAQAAADPQVLAVASDATMNATYGARTEKGAMVLNAAYLVDVEHEDTFLETAARLNERQKSLGFALICTGPRVPLSFWQ